MARQRKWLRRSVIIVAAVIPLLVAGVNFILLPHLITAARSAARLLIIHREDDPKVPADRARRIHQAAPGRSELLVVPSEDHDSLLADRAGVVRRTMSAWLQRWLVIPAATRPTGAGRR